MTGFDAEVISNNSEKDTAMITELRLYRPVSGREEALVNRFRTSTLKIFFRHKIKVLDFWVADDESLIAYTCEWQSTDEMRQGWARFREDDEWRRSKAATEVQGPLVEEIISTVVSTPAFFRTSR
jgi:hypothetical protein